MINGLKPIQPASNEVVRDINRRIVLNLLRTRQPASRADLARVSGMQRSTISLIVEELIREKWIIEGPTGRLPRGRRPTFLRLNEERALIGVDIRPTHTAIALLDINGKFTHQEEFDTPALSTDAIAEIVTRIARLQQSAKGAKPVELEGVGISIPGRLDPATNRIAFAPNLGWCDVDIRGPVAQATNLDVEIENAANACALAAIWFDGMESCRNMVVLTISEGIGAGILINGKLAGGMAGEFGHVPLDPSGPLCRCGSHGCWEVFGSNSAALRYYAEAASPPVKMPFSDLLTLAGKGDTAASAAIGQMADCLGQGMRMIVAGLAPERILVVGDLTRSWHLFGPRIQAELRKQVLPGGIAPELMPVGEGGMARLRGTAALVLQKHFGEHFGDVRPPRKRQAAAAS